MNDNTHKIKHSWWNWNEIRWLPLRLCHPNTKGLENTFGKLDRVHGMAFDHLKKFQRQDAMTNNHDVMSVSKDFTGHFLKNIKF